MDTPATYLFLTVREAAHLLRCSEAHIYTLCKSGRLGHEKLGSRTLIKRVALEELAGVSLFEMMKEESESRRPTISD